MTQDRTILRSKLNACIECPLTDEQFEEVLRIRYADIDYWEKRHEMGEFMKREGIIEIK